MAHAPAVTAWDSYLANRRDEWAVGRRYFSESMAKLTQPFTEEVIETLLAL